MILVLRLLVIPALLLVLVARYGLPQALVRRSQRVQRIARRIEIVAFAYVAAILISAALRIAGVIDFSG